MGLLYYSGHLLAAFYTVIGGGMLWRASKPSCRICVHRGYCQRRVGGFVVPECAKKKPEAQNPGVPAASE
jgi:hypothetical protein